MTNFTFSAALVEDAPTLARLMQAAWPDDVPDLARISAVLSEGGHTTLLAWVGEQAAGFVDCFGTTSLGVATYEIDLLAVAPTARGHGVASAIVAEVTRLATAEGYRTARALVAVDNLPMQSVMLRAGYIPSDRVHALLVNSESHIPDKAEGNFSDVHLLPVSTLTYRGGWLLPPFTPAKLEGAIAVRQQAGLELVGAVIPYDAGDQVENAKRMGYQPIGDYHWWERQLG